MERETGFEPATSTLARSHSTTELLPLSNAHYKRPFSAQQTNQGNLPFTPPSLAPLTNSGVSRSIFMMPRPLRILLRRDDLPIPHVDDFVAVFRRFRVMRDHQNSLAQFLV
jgi:hypothetical protein